MKKKNIGQILVERNVITQAQLDLALTRQKLERGKYLGQILFEMGVPQDEINKALDHFDKRKPFGQTLIDLKSVTNEQLEEALEKQKQLRKEGVRKPLGMLLVELGYTNYDSYLKALSRYFNMPTVSLEKFTPSSDLQKAVGERYAQKHRIVVLENSASTIKLALAEPSIYRMEELRKALPLGKRVEFYLANPYDIETCLKKKTGSTSLTPDQ
jgi:DNA-binding transcriptional MerR regulator